jgi:hypothetical protein
VIPSASPVQRRPIICVEGMHNLAFAQNRSSVFGEPSKCSKVESGWSSSSIAWRGHVAVPFEEKPLPEVRIGRIKKTGDRAKEFFISDIVEACVVCPVADGIF